MLCAAFVRRGHLASRSTFASNLRHTYTTSSTPASFTPTSDFSHLLQRKIAPIFDDLSPAPSYRLQLTLHDFLKPTASSDNVSPSICTTALPAASPPPLPPALPLVLPLVSAAVPLPIAHHLVYFEPALLASEMLPDGTNPAHTPGAAFVRRMWAGGRVRLNPTHASSPLTPSSEQPTSTSPLLLDGSRAVCAEFIRAATPKGTGVNEKVFVDIERRLARASASEIQDLDALSTATPTPGTTDRLSQLHHRVRQRLWRAEEDDFGPAAIIETRRLVFMQTPSPSSAAASSPPPPRKTLLPPHPAQYTHTLTPDAKLLFRFSALTFNAHAIHLDRLWTRDQEGHPDLLFHGPLSLVFLLTCLTQHLPRGKAVRSVDYRNLSPLYCGRPVSFCGACIDAEKGKWEIWAQDDRGGMAVKASVIVGDVNV